MTTTNKQEQLDQVGDVLRSLVAEDRGDEAIELALSLLDRLQSHNTELLLKLASLQRERSGRRSEKIDPKQLSLMLELLGKDSGADVAETEAEDQALDAELADAESPERPRGRPRRRKPPKELPRDVFRHELPPQERLCPGCGQEMPLIGEDVSEFVELVPAHFRVQEHRRAKYACGRCKETVKTAPGPAKLIEKGLAGPGLLAHAAISKFSDHVPLTRLQEIYRRGGYETSVSTLCGWIAGVAREVEPIVNRIWEKALACKELQTDGSGLKVLDRDDPEGIRRGTMWCYVGDRKCVVFKYAPSGSGKDGPWRHLEGREGYLQADAATVFDRLYDGQQANAIEVGCWAHARRKYEALKDSDVRVAYPLKLISQLYRVEELADRKKLTPEERRELRLSRSRRILDRLHRWIIHTITREPPESALCKACGYTQRQWHPLTRFLEDGVLPLDNNLCELQIRSLAVGRKNYLFAGSDAGAERAAVLYSLLRTCALQGVDTYAYLIDVIKKLASGWSQLRLDELLPENWTYVPVPRARDLKPAS